MPSRTIDTVQLQHWIDRMRAGDAEAREELVRRYFHRLERLARKMLHKYPRVQRWEDTGDVLNPAVVRLLRALEEVRPASTRDFLTLAAVQIRRELLNLSEHYYGPHGIGAHHDSAQANADTVTPRSAGPPTLAEDADDLNRWSAFHRAVERLPDEEREVVSLLYYHGVTKVQAADLLGINERTVRRRWSRAQAQLREFIAEADTAS